MGLACAVLDVDFVACDFPLYASQTVGKPGFQGDEGRWHDIQKPVSGKLSISGQCRAYFRRIIRCCRRVDRHLLHVTIRNLILSDGDCARSRD